jgi:hypothetical protein
MVHRLQKLNCRIVEVPVHHYPRESGRSQFFRFRAVGETLLQLAYLFFRRSPGPRLVAKEISETIVE